MHASSVIRGVNVTYLVKVHGYRSGKVLTIETQSLPAIATTDPGRSTIMFLQIDGWPYMYNNSDTDAPCWIIENWDEVHARTLSVQFVTSHSSHYFQFTVTRHATNNHNCRHITSHYSVLPRGHATRGSNNGFGCTVLSLTWS
jgi:hypothetical protein